MIRLTSWPRQHDAALINCRRELVSGVIIALSVIALGVKQLAHLCLDNHLGWWFCGMVLWVFSCGKKEV